MRVPEALRRLNFIFFDDPDPRFEASADQLAEALQTDIGWIRQHTEFGELARRWSAAGRPGGLLLRSPALEEAERWIASRPPGAPSPTEETQASSPKAGAARRGGATSSPGALRPDCWWRSRSPGWPIGSAAIAVQERQIADEQRECEQQRKRAEDTLAAATKTANSLVFDLAQRFENAVGVPAALVKEHSRPRDSRCRSNSSGPGR